MKRGIDTNVLVYAHIAACPQHARARRRLLAELGDPEVTVVLSPLVLHEFMHVITDGRRFEPPVSMPEAVALARGYVGRANVEVAPVGEAALRTALDQLERHQLGRKRIADTLLAASLIAAGATEILTCNPGDFAHLPGLRPVDPLA